MTGEVIAAGCLAVAGGWRAAIVESDVRHLRRTRTDGRAYRPELGWTDGILLARRRSWARVGLVAAGALAVTAVGSAAGWGPAAPLVWPAAGIAMGVWLVRDSRLHHGRYTSVCVTTLAVGVALAGVATAAAGLLASVAAAQLYLVAGIRKVRSRDFMSGRVVLDNVAYGACQAAAGNGEFLRTVTPARLADLLERGTLLRGCRALSMATAAAELAVGVGATGLLPVPVTFALAVPMHIGFTLLCPRRLVPFTVASLGLLALATGQPLFGAG